MGLLVECPECRRRNSVKNARCPCGTALQKMGYKVYWVEYYGETGRRRRERIGPSKEAAKQRLRDIMKARTEERYIQKDLGARVTFGELCRWYLELPEVKGKASYERDVDSAQNLRRLLGETTKVRDLSAGKIESYQRIRLTEPSRVHPGASVRPATVNREVSCLKSMVNRAIHHGKLNENPIKKVKKLAENNVRERILSQDEFERLVTACEPHIRPVVVTAYYTGMRRAEILRLTWDEVDLDKRFIRLHGSMTKTGVGRSVPLHPRVADELSRLPRGLKTNRVFLRRGRSFDDVKKSFRAACGRAGIKDFTFHDLRHCAINNLRVAGNDYFKIMAMSGHRTMSVFKRYNVVTEQELNGVIWHDQGHARG